MAHESAITKIVVGVDGSDASLEALRQAQELADPFNAQIEAIACWEFPQMYDGYVLVGIEGFQESAAKILNQSVERVYGPETPRNVKTSLVQGNPKSSLIKASENADMLIVGRRGRGAFSGLHLGSVSSACIAHAKCPVLVVHAPETGTKD
ncbi:universal stress protein [Arthrobacter crystallopoietes]|uniref:universal stress protein n=1 Tax=Crystallibacter crystallopoietes TaxID=37928 RepID=UPI001111189B|nr:universal stress protein [Arthrobacter crystallopoietes]